MESQAPAHVLHCTTVLQRDALRVTIVVVIFSSRLVAGCCGAVDLQLERSAGRQKNRLPDHIAGITELPDCVWLKNLCCVVCSAIDKLDKEPWDVVRAEMVEEKGLPGDVADTIGQFVVLK
jgi:hypothetical protein